MLANKKKIWAVVPSAGSGTRMEQTIPKQYLELQGRAVIEHTLATLLAEPKIAEIIVCVADGDEYWQRLDCAKDPRVTNTTGGATRAHSVLNGIECLTDKADDNDWVLVHDAARPCLTNELLASFIDQLKNDKVGGILAVQSTDTVKQAADNNRREIETTLDRELIWYAQTPQMFRYSLLKRVLEYALNHREPITDEASAIELGGFRPKLIVGDARNIKVTMPEDLDLAEFLIN